MEPSMHPYSPGPIVRHACDSRINCQV